jgi:hypothetical protein
MQIVSCNSSASYDSFVGKKTLVLRINICGEIPPLRQAAKRVCPESSLE